MTIEYDGTDYFGWQVQPGVRTVQGEIERVLARLCGRHVPVAGAGRTDRGVHALGQVAHVDVEEKEFDRLQKGLNSLLPDDVSVVSLESAEKTFHARFDAVSRLYSYRAEKERHPLRSRYCHVVRSRLDTKAMILGARFSLGSNCWKAMAKEGSSNRDWMVNVMQATVTEDRRGWTFTIRANRFLRGMVRIWVGTLLGIGSGRMEPELITRLLETGNRNGAGRSLPGKGLTLVEVSYN